MKQRIWGNAGDNYHASTVEYASVERFTGLRSTESHRYTVCPASGTMSGLNVQLGGAPGAGKSITFVLMVNGSPSTLTVTISGDTDTFGADSANEVSITAGDLLSIRTTPSGTPTVSPADWNMTFTGSTDKESILMGLTAQIGFSASATEFSGLSGWTGQGPDATEANTQQLCAGAGTIKSLYVKLVMDPGTAPDAYRFTVRLNGSSTVLTTTITADDTTGSDLVNSFTVAPGDLLTIMSEPLNTPSVEPFATWGVVFLADTDGESLVLAGTANTLHQSNTEFMALRPNQMGSLWVTASNSHNNYMGPGVLRKMYVRLSVAPGSGGDSYTFSPRHIDVEAGNQSVTITDAETTGSDTVNKDAIDEADVWNIGCVPANGPTNAPQAWWGFVMFIGVDKGAKGSMGRAMVAAGYI
ncbi:hypothetical protein LCGC14_0378470 [marine sediment metagenome]|uniref:Uncharacterized protein n=1 Tax=marine sediment metagenome TaxID=412755 RepID=A0A0F9T8Q2_9ZZZZ